MGETWVVVGVSLLLVGVLGFAGLAPPPAQAHHSTPGDDPVSSPSDRALSDPWASRSPATDQRTPAADQHMQPTDQHMPPADQLVSPVAEPTALWPYMSRSRSTAGRTLAINVIVAGDPETVRVALTERADRNWTGVGGDVNVTVRESAASWRSAHGAERYTYVATPERPAGEWIDSSYQLASGSHLGERVHVRAYAAPSGNWTALQAHGEYWDWFRLRHTVTSVAPAATFVREDLQDEPYVRNVSRQHHGLRGGGSSGWFVVVELATLTMLLGATVARTELARADVALPIAIVSIVLGVRLLGIGAETILPFVPPKVFAGLLYPVLVAGPPLAVSRLTSDRSGVRTGVIAAGALALALVLDASFIGVVDPPQRLVYHRLALVVAFGVLAGAIATTSPRTTAFGVIAWLLALAAPLFGVL